MYLIDTLYIFIKNTSTAEILNLVIFPAITYRMNIIKYSNDIVKK
jgi:hypothetical protein